MDDDPMDCGTTERLFRSIARNAAQGVSLGKRKSKPTFVDGEIRVPPPTFRTPFGPARPPKAVLKKIRWNRKRISLRRARVAHFVRPFLRPPRSGAFLTQQDTPARSNKVVILPWCLVKRLFNSFKAQLRCHGNCRHWNFTTRRELGSLRWLVRICAGDPEWEKHLDLAALYLRYKIRADSGMSAYEMRFGKPMKLVQFLKYGADEPNSMDAAELQQHMKKVYQQEDERAMKQKERYDRGRKQPKYEEGDKVWLKVNDAGLFDKKRRGPYVILEKLTDLNYRIGEIGKEKYTKFSNVVNVKQMAEYTPEVEDGEEWKVKKVIEHKEYRRKGLWFVVEWATGEITEEPVDVFVDIVDGKKIWNEKVLKYAKRHKVNLDVTR